MTSTAFKKQDQKKWLTNYFEQYIKELELDKLHDFAMGCVLRLMGQMTLRQLTEWRGNLEATEDE